MAAELLETAYNTIHKSEITPKEKMALTTTDIDILRACSKVNNRRTDESRHGNTSTHTQNVLKCFIKIYECPSFVHTSS
jgi:hypothetical protein